MSLKLPNIVKRQKVKYPGIDNLKTKLISRSIGKSREEHLGVGFMHKKGVEIDEQNLCCSKYALIYVIRGVGEYLDLHGNRYPLTAGTVFQRHPGVKHSTFIDPKSDWAECFIDFGRSLYNTLVAYKIINPELFVYNIISDRTIELECFDIMIRLENCSEVEFSFVASDMILLTSKIMQSSIAPPEDEHERFIDESCIYFSENPDKRIELKQYCKKSGIGYEHYRKLFRQKIGISPGQYIVNRRMDAACQMLRISRIPINEIASKLGYSTQYEFSAQFKKFIGLSPKKYRGG